MNCALGISQLSRLEAVIERRQELAEEYARELRGVGGIVRPPLASAVGRISWFVYVIRLDDEFSRAERDEICQAMLLRGIATGRYFAPLHLQPVFTAEAQKREVPRLRHTEALADRVLALPFFNELTLAQIHEVCGALDESIRELRRKT